MKKLREKIKNLEGKNLIKQMLFMQLIYITFIVIKIIQKDYAGAFFLFSVNVLAGYYLNMQYKKIIRNNRRMKAHKAALMALFDNEKRAEMLIKQCEKYDKICIKCDDEICPRSPKNAIHIYVDKAKIITKEED